MQHKMGVIVALSTLAFMALPDFQNSLNKLIMLSSLQRPISARAYHFTWLHFILNKIIDLDFYNRVIYLQTHKQRAKVLTATLPFSLCPSGRPQQSSACSVLRHPCCTSGFLYSVLLIRWTHKIGPPPTIHHPQTGFYFERETFFKWVTKSCRMRVFDMTALTAREPLLHNEENGTRSKSCFSTAPPPPQLNRSLLVYRVSPQMQCNAAGGRSRSSEYSPRAASSHFLSHESFFPVRLNQPS